MPKICNLRGYPHSRCVAEPQPCKSVLQNSPNTSCNLIVARGRYVFRPSNTLTSCQCETIAAHLCYRQPSPITSAIDNHRDLLSSFFSFPPLTSRSRLGRELVEEGIVFRRFQRILRPLSRAFNPTLILGKLFWEFHCG
ncbi:unnamed protein product [Lactuca saligna]|uniref:Uncharacterized protein n=1 Tax=Lactuca saligna TaxID=75948 RepID=A0AA35V5D1_LACSI|nr:unnamed protein product [Lactuca saligna]